MDLIEVQKQFQFPDVKSPLNQAAQSGNIEQIKIFLENGSKLCEFVFEVCHVNVLDYLLSSHKQPKLVSKIKKKITKDLSPDLSPDLCLLITNHPYLIQGITLDEYIKNPTKNIKLSAIIYVETKGGGFTCIPKEFSEYILREYPFREGFEKLIRTETCLSDEVIQQAAWLPSSYVLARPPNKMLFQKMSDLELGVGVHPDYWSYQPFLELVAVNYPHMLLEKVDKFKNNSIIVDKFLKNIDYDFAATNPYKIVWLYVRHDNIIPDLSEILAKILSSSFIKASTVYSIDDKELLVNFYLRIVYYIGKNTSIINCDKHLITLEDLNIKSLSREQQLVFLKIFPASSSVFYFDLFDNELKEKIGKKIFHEKDFNMKLYEHGPKIFMEILDKLFSAGLYELSITGRNFISLHLKEILPYTPTHFFNSISFALMVFNELQNISFEQHTSVINYLYNNIYELTKKTQDNVKYEYALVLLNNNQTNKAIEILLSLDDYKDSNRLLRNIFAEKMGLPFGNNSLPNNFGLNTETILWLIERKK